MDSRRMRAQASFLYLGRLEREKGVLELCEAFSRAFPSPGGIQLQIAGWGTLLPELQEKYGMHPGISFLGAVDGNAKEDALCNATTVVIPSLWDEVFGVVTIEAFAYGKPVIASKAGGLPELVKPAETGWLVEPGSVHSLSDQLRFVADIHPNLLLEMSQNCKDYSYEFAVERILGEYLELYGELIK
jgi:glycosyltransferase involved in cell wall biosynthesis